VVNLRTNNLSLQPSPGSSGAPGTDRGILARAGTGIAEWITPPILVPLTAAAAIAAYGFYLRLW